MRVVGGDYLHRLTMPAVLQQIRGNSSPASISTALSPPTAVSILTFPTGSAATSPMMAAAVPSG